MQFPIEVSYENNTLIFDLESNPKNKELEFIGSFNEISEEKWKTIFPSCGVYTEEKNFVLVEKIDLFPNFYEEDLLQTAKQSAVSLLLELEIKRFSDQLNVFKIKQFHSTF